MHRRRSTILIVGEDKELYESLRHLSNDHFFIQTAHNAVGGLRMISDDPSISLIVFDLFVSETSSIEMLEKLRGEGSKIYAIVVTGKSCHDLAIKCADLGVHGYMIKPVEPAYLSERIMRLINHSGDNYFNRLFENEFNKEILTFSTRAIKAINFIWKNHKSYYIREEVATHLNVTGDYLCKVLKRESGLGLNECISRIRILASKQLIRRNPEKKIREIAVAVGISDVNYFCRIFRKYNKLTPGKYKKLISL